MPRGTVFTMAGTPTVWRDVPFSEAVVVNPQVDLDRGRDYPHVDMALLTPGVRSVSAVDTREYRSGGSRFERGDTLFARITPCLENGKTSRFDPSDPDAPGLAHGSTEFIVLRGRANVSDTDFVHYLAKSPTVRDFAIGQMTGTSGRQRVPVDCFDHLLVSVPPIPEQRAIAHILGALDDKIELNRGMSETLEAMARALFKSWFVDFEPVRAKMDGRDTGLHPDITALLPDGIIDTERGPTPTGWSRESLQSIVTLNPESWTPKNPPTRVTYIDLKNTKWGRIERCESYAWDDAPSRARRVLRPSDTVVGTVRPGNGSYALIDEDGLTGSTGFAVLRPLARFDREIVWCASTSKENIERLTHLADGAAYPAVRAETVAATPIVLAADNVRHAFSGLVGPLLERAAHARRESARLARLRDTLLPQLISGELRVAQSDTPVVAAL